MCCHHFGKVHKKRIYPPGKDEKGHYNQTKPGTISKATLHGEISQKCDGVHRDVLEHVSMLNCQAKNSQSLSSNSNLKQHFYWEVSVLLMKFPCLQLQASAPHR